MKKRNKIISMMMAAAMVVSSFGYGSISVSAQGTDGESTEEKQYVIVAEDKAAYDEVAEEIGGSILTEDSVLTENHVIVAELTEQEAAALEADDILVEEDFELEANELDEPDWEENPPLTREEVTALKLKFREERNA